MRHRLIAAHTPRRSSSRPSAGRVIAGTTAQFNVFSAPRKLNAFITLTTPLREEVRSLLFECIYNSHRLHSDLGYISSVDYELRAV